MSNPKNESSPAGATSTAAATSTAPSGGHASGEHHVLPLKLYFGVWLALVVLTWITVAVAQFDFGAMNLIVAMGIATVKASLVVLFFMHLAFDKPINAIVLIISLLFVSLFITFTMIDTHQYRGQNMPGYAPDIITAQENAK